MQPYVRRAAKQNHIHDSKQRCHENISDADAAAAVAAADDADADDDNDNNGNLTTTTTMIGIDCATTTFPVFVSPVLRDRSAALLYFSSS